MRNTKLPTNLNPIKFYLFTMKVVLFIILVIFSLNLQAQNYFDALVDNEKISKAYIKAYSSNSIYTEHDSYQVKSIDSIKFYFLPKYELIEKLDQYGVKYEIYRIKKSSMSAFENGEIIEPDHDWIATSDYDTLYGYLSLYYSKILFNDPFGTNPMKFKLKEIKGYKRDSLIFSNYDGMKQLLISGKVNLYMLFKRGYQNSVDRYIYYARRNTELDVTFLTSNPTLLANKTLKKNALNYFSDCPSLIEKIENDVLGAQEIEKIVNYYNSNCPK